MLPTALFVAGVSAAAAALEMPVSVTRAGRSLMGISFESARLSEGTDQHRVYTSDRAEVDGESLRIKCVTYRIVSEPWPRAGISGPS
jgi:hypothetical protein